MHKNETVIFTGLSHSLFHIWSPAVALIYNSDVADAADAATVLRRETLMSFKVKQ
jgi:hypothetical protein